MLKIIAGIVVVLVVAIAVVLILAAAKPDTFKVARSTRINAPPEKIFAFLNDFHRFPEWSPYENRDPAMQRTFSGAESGKGAVYAWDGNKDVGQGRMEILSSTPSSNITIKLDFMRPFEGHNTVEFTLVPDGTSTTVTWAMSGPLPYMAKIIHVFINMDKMVGGDFAAGLANLKSLAER